MKLHDRGSSLKSLNLKVRHAITKVRWRESLWDAMYRARQSRAKALQEFKDPVRFRVEVRHIKEKSIEDLDYLIQNFIYNAKKKGAKVYLAKDALDAISYILRLLEEKNCKLVIKSKSLTSEEIEMNKYIEEKGINIVETDLGELIIQLSNEKPFHLVYPAVHKTRKDVADLLSEKFNIQVKNDIKDIMQAVRKILREVFLDSDAGITGANVAIADTGTVVIETNEGNARLVSSIPKLHIVIMGMEKIVSNLDEALKIIRSHPVSSTGQRLTTYVSFISGRNPLGNVDGRELHIVVLDNGRSRLRYDGWLKEALYCIRCGACMNICPTYSVVGGHVFGFIYPGPIGIPWTASVHGLDKASSFAPLCISCGLCKEICPVDIDIPMMIAKVKYLSVIKDGQQLTNRILEEYEKVYKLAYPIAPIFNWIVRNKIVRVVMEHTLGLDRRRPLPEVRYETFVRWFSRRYVPSVKQKRKVALFLDFFSNYCYTEIAKRTTNLLESAGVAIKIPPQLTSGYPYVAYGDINKAKNNAEINVNSLYQVIKHGYDIVSLEPTATYSLKITYPKLLNNSKESVLVANHTHELFEYIHMLVKEGLIKLRCKTDGEKIIGFHIPCHQRALSEGRFTVELLKIVGFRVKIIETGTCCGMAGSFGFKKGPLGYELANEVGKNLFSMFKDSGVDLIATESNICRIHIEQGTGLKVIHPISLL